MHCQYCGAPMAEQDTACSLCGKSNDQQTRPSPTEPASLSGQEPLWSENFSAVYQEPQVAETRQRGKAPLLTVLGLVLALLVAAGIKFYPNLLLAVNPKGYVDLAYNRTESDLTQRMAQISAAFGSDFNETLRAGQAGSTMSLSLEGIQQDGQPIQIPSDFLDDIRLQVNSDIDYLSNRRQDRLTLSLLGEEFSLLSYADEEMLAFALPGIYPQNMGVYADTLVQDWNASPLGETFALSEDTQIDLGALFDPSRTLIQKTSDEDNDTLFDLAPLNTLLKNAKYTNVGKGSMHSGGAAYTRVQVTLSGADVKALVRDLLVQVSGWALAGGQDMLSMLEEIENTAFEDVVILFYTNGSHRMVGAEMTLTVKDEYWDTEESVVFALALGSDSDPLDGCSFSILSATGEALFTLGHDAIQSDSPWAGQIYLSVDSGYGVQTMTVEYAYAPDTPDENLSVIIDVPDMMRLTLRGGLHTDRAAKRQIFTLDSIEMDDGWQTISVQLACKMETFAQSKEVDAWSNVQKVTDMSQADWESILYDLQNKFYALMPMFSGMSMM